MVAIEASARRAVRANVSGVASEARDKAIIHGIELSDGSSRWRMKRARSLEIVIEGEEIHNIQRHRIDLAAPGLDCPGTFDHVLQEGTVDGGRNAGVGGVGSTLDQLGRIELVSKSDGDCASAGSPRLPRRSAPTCGHHSSFARLTLILIAELSTR